MRGYTPSHKNRPPCFGCKHCVQSRDSYYISYMCMAKSKKGHELYRIAAYQESPYREKAMAFLENQIRNRMRPLWCPEEKIAQKRT